MYTTLNQIKSHRPCTEGWQTLLKALGKSKADNEPLPLSFILKSNGLDDAIWSLRCLQGADKELRLFAVECARQVQHLMTDPRSLAALDMAEKFANGQATYEELEIARNAAWTAADAAWAAAVAAAWAAADAAWAAAVAAAWTAADAARDMARDAAAYAAAGAAAYAAAGAAADAAGAARTKQGELFQKYFGNPNSSTSTLP